MKPQGMAEETWEQVMAALEDTMKCEIKKMCTNEVTVSASDVELITVVYLICPYDLFFPFADGKVWCTFEINNRIEIIVVKVTTK